MNFLICLILAISSMGGINRTEDAYLTQLAQQRAVEISVNFQHRPMPELSGRWWGEVISWNDSSDIVVAEQGWLSSPSHRAILIDPSFTTIGCAEHIVGARHYHVCIFGTNVVNYQPPPKPVPNTAMRP